jgi:sugar lactone lactonase YvrE
MTAGTTVEAKTQSLKTLTFLLISLALSVTAMAVSVPRAFSAEGRSLDPLLSLIGACAEPQALDPVEDPGCPTTLPEGAHPPAPFAVPTAVTTDFYGNVYVSNFGKLANGSQGRIDVFGPDGRFIAELKTTGPTSIAVDSKGNLYVVAEIESTKPILRFEPSLYNPEAGEIAYANPAVPIPMAGVNELAIFSGIAINSENDHLFANFGSGGLVEYDSAVNDNAELRTTPLPTWPYGVGVAVDAARHLVYVSVLEKTETTNEKRIEIYDLNQLEGEAPGTYKKVGTIEASAVPEGKFGNYLSVAVDEATGNIFVLDGDLGIVYQLAADGSYLGSIEHSLNEPFGAEIGVDNGPFSPHGALSDNGRYLYVPSGKTGVGHSYAFEESSFNAPEVKSVSVTGISTDEAEILASVNSGNLVTSYSFEYVTEAQFEEEGFAGATAVGPDQLPAGNLDDEASGVATGLQPGTAYRFRIVAANAKGSGEMVGGFSTYPSYSNDPAPCANQLLRTGLSALLPDCRAYELVTPADTNGRAPLGIGREGGNFTTRQVSPAGDKVPFRVEGGTLPGSGGTGSYLGDPFLASRGATGWSTAYIGPTAAEAVAVTPGWTSPDQGYSFWTAESKGYALYEGVSTSYLRFPDGHSEILGQGSIGIDPEAVGALISEDGDHVIFATGALDRVSTAVQIEPDAAPSGTAAIYDRTADGVVHVVSLKPGGARLVADENVVLQGTSLDGKGVAFTVNKTLYLRYQNEETFEIGEGVEFAGLAEGGNLLFYVEGGQLWRFDATTGERVAFSSGVVTPVNVSADGSTAYFVSTAKLTSELNPNGEAASADKQNLYVSKEGALRFIATVTDRDVKGMSNGTSQVDGLGLWVLAVSRKETSPGRLSIDPSRTSLDGSVLLFQSRAPLTGDDPGGYSQVYRYDSQGERLHCLSCNPTRTPATGDARLQSENREGFALFFSLATLENLRADGRRAIFESPEPLVPGDTDGLQDVYEWEDSGVGTCASPGGCVSLISSGHSERNDYLYAVSESGNDVFFLSSDLLLPGDQDETPSIYDARVGGGFPEPVQANCEGEGCRPQITPPPPLAAAQTLVHGAGDNFKNRHCSKRKRKVKRAGKIRCVKKKAHHHHHRASTDKKESAK